MKGNLWTFVVVLVLLGVMVTGASVLYDGSLESHDVTSESITLVHDEAVSVNFADVADRFDENVSVYNESETFEAGSDYTWNASAGTVTTLNATLDNTSASIDYTYLAAPETSRDIAPLADRIMAVLVYGMVFLVAGAAIVGLASKVGGR